MGRCEFFLVNYEKGSSIRCVIVQVVADCQATDTIKEGKRIQTMADARKKSRYERQPGEEVINIGPGVSPA